MTESIETVVVDWVIFKVAQRCNLDCSYCYVYNRGDDSWESRPKFISENVAKAFAQRINEQCEKYEIPRFMIELHGGEALLLGKQRMQALLDLFRRECKGVQVDFSLQTNGLLLDEEWLRLLVSNGVGVGISCDGPPESADRRRTYRNGRGSTLKLIRTIEHLRQSSSLYNDLNPGILCVVDPTLNGADVVRWFVQHDIQSFDLLLPNGTYVNLPQDWTGVEPYRRFLLEAFEEWFGMGKDAPRIRLFELMMRGLLGVRPSLDCLGGDLRRLCVIETDGSIGLSDLIRVCGDRFVVDDLNVFNSPLDAIDPHYGLNELQDPCEECHSCQYFNACGGGLLPHRYDVHSFQNPSIYCRALYALADAAFDRLRTELPHLTLPTRNGEIVDGPRREGGVAI